MCSNNSSAIKPLQRVCGLGEDMHLRGKCAKRRFRTDLSLQRRQLGVGGGVAVEHGLRHMISNGADAVTGEHGETCRSDEIKYLIMVQSRPLGKNSSGLRDVSSERLGENHAPALRHQQAEDTAWAQYPCHCPQRLRGRIDDFENAMADHDVGCMLADQRDKVCRVALNSVHPSVQVCLGRTAVQRSQSISARIDDRNRVTLAGQRSCQASGTPAQVDHFQGSGLTRDQLAELRFEQGEEETLRH